MSDLNRVTKIENGKKYILVWVLEGAIEVVNDDWHYARKERKEE